jgi:hypothetical protein
MSRGRKNLKLDPETHEFLKGLKPEDETWNDWLRSLGMRYAVEE